MADSSPTSSKLSQTFTSRLPLMTWLAIALVFLVAITISADSDPANPDDGASLAATGDESGSDGDDSSGQPGSEESDVSASDGEAAPAGEPNDADSSSGSATGSIATVPGDGDTGNDPATTDPDDESASAPATTISGTPSATTVAGATPATTTVPGAAPPPTTTAAAPTTTIVVTAPTTTIVVTAPPTTTIPPPALTEGCSVLRTDEFGDLEIELTAVSPTAEVAQLEIGFELRDAAGEVFLPDFLVVEFVAPGEVMRIAVLTFEPVPPGNDVSSISCEITGLEVIELFDDQELPGPDDTCSVIGVDEIGDIQLDVTVRNPVTEPVDLIFTYAVRDQQGVRVISDVGFADGLDPGQISTQQIDTLIPPPAGLDPSTLTCDIVGHELF